MAKYDIEVDLGNLDGPDGNAYAVTGKIYRAITAVDGKPAADAWLDEAFRSRSYKDLLTLCQETVIIVSPLPY